MKLETEIFIDAPPAVVFAAAIDIPRWPERVQAITKVEMLSEGPIGIGTRFRETRMMFGREASEEMEITAFAPPNRFATQAQNCGTRYLSEHLFEPVDGGTKVVFAFSGEPVTLMARLTAPLGRLMMPSIVKAIEGDLRDLKVAVEKEHGKNTGR